jgi:hypothetical protein
MLNRARGIDVGQLLEGSNGMSKLSKQYAWSAKPDPLSHTFVRTNLLPSSTALRQHWSELIYQVIVCPEYQNVSSKLCGPIPISFKPASIYRYA